jgi:hypothetical protein
MIVALNARRRGIAARILDALLQEAAQRSMRTLGLVATPFGQPLYEHRGSAVCAPSKLFRMCIAVHRAKDVAFERLRAMWSA